MSSFDSEVRSQFDPKTLLKILQRTVWRSEAIRETKDTLEGHVHKIPFAIDTAYAMNEVQNDGNVTRGTYVPYEPTNTGGDVMVYQNFNAPGGLGQKSDVVINTVDYDRIILPDQGYAGSNTLRYYVLNGTDSWLWARDCPPVQKLGWSAFLNQGSNDRQFLAFDGGGTDFDYTANNFSEQFWFKPTDLAQYGAKATVKHFYPTRLPQSNPNSIIKMYTVDASNFYTIELDLTDFKVFMDFVKAGVHTKKESAQAVTPDAWNHLAYTWAFTTPTLSPRLNDTAFVASTKTGLGAVTGASGRPSYGSYGGAPANRSYRGNIGYIIYYKHTTVLTTAEMTNLYNWGTKYAVTNKRPYIIPFALLSQT